MKAHQAAENDPPSAHLIALIRAGKLTEVGFALPRPLNKAPDDERNAGRSLPVVCAGAHRPAAGANPRLAGGG
jgi:hypothetical protein